MSTKIPLNEETEKLFLDVLKMYCEDKMTYEQIGRSIRRPKDYVYCLVKAYKEKYQLGKIITQYDYLCLTDEIKNVINKYQQGLSMTAIGKDYKTSERTIAGWLRRQQVLIRPSGVVSKIDQSIFDVIDSEIKAYTLGLIMSDGNVSSEGNTISITLTQDDSYILEAINEELFSGLANIVISHQADKKPRAILQFNGKHLKEILSLYGIVPAKSHLLSQLPRNIPESLYHHFLRGLYDGDGVCSYYTSHKIQKVRIGFCAANQEFVHSYQNYFVLHLDMNRTKLFNTGNCWQCSWGSQKDLKAFFDFIYKDATIYLGRKYKKLKQFLFN